jgi:membrane peptidoglycan carboxypeptidase
VNTFLGSARRAQLGWALRVPRVLARYPRVWLGAATALAAVVVFYEIQSSALAARLLARYAARLSFRLEAGPSPSVAFPTDGPFDMRRGYTRIPEFEARLRSAGLEVGAQARFSPALLRLYKLGIAPPYREPLVTGLLMRGSGGEVLYDARPTDRTFAGIQDIPPLVQRTLLFMEDRELLRPRDARNNPAVDWPRLAKATLLYAGAKFGLPLSVQGGSTLATQLEKFRHSREGRTDSIGDKVRQIAAASLKAYRSGADTTAWRQSILVDYLNAMPLAAVPGYGEVLGLGSGLEAWFGLSLASVRDALLQPEATAEKVHAYKHVLALLAALPAPTTYLIHDTEALERRINSYLPLLTQAGVIDAPFADAVRAVPLRLARGYHVAPVVDFVDQKATRAVRTHLLSLLGLSSLYELDRLHLDAESTIDVTLQRQAVTLFANLGRPDFVKANHLSGKRLLDDANLQDVIYSLLLFEHTPEGHLLRVRADTIDQPFDLSHGAKLELGSTAKLRTLTHYLELVAEIHAELAPLDRERRKAWTRRARDPISKWAGDALVRNETLGLDDLLAQALERRYSASPWPAFFTGGGTHHFSNYDPDDNGLVLSVQQAFARSTNLVFIRLMRDLVDFHRARLSYDADAVLADVKDPVRRRLLEDAVAAESQQLLARFYRRYRDLTLAETVRRLLRTRVTERRLAVLFYAWYPGSREEDLGEWLRGHLGPIPPARVHRLARAYGNPQLGLPDHAYLLSRHSLEVWCAGELLRTPDLSWGELLARGAEARRISSAWLFQPRNRRAQERHLRQRIEQDAFQRMAPYWKRLGFPFDRLVPTYATAIGSSGDRPAALAELMGIIVADGLRHPMRLVTRLHFAAGTPYETMVAPAHREGARVMSPAVASTLRHALAAVVEGGTARRLAGVFVDRAKAPVLVGAKTGTGDNRHRTFSRSGAVRSSRAVNRTATVAFYIGDRYFGVLTAFVPGEAAARHRFTSALPVALLGQVAPAINVRLEATSEHAPDRSPGTASVASEEQPATEGAVDGREAGGGTVQAESPGVLPAVG